MMEEKKGKEGGKKKTILKKEQNRSRFWGRKIKMIVEKEARKEEKQF